MSNVNLPIGGRNFAVSCAEGEETHIEMLGRMVEERTRKMSGAQSETRMLLFAALMLADELHDAHRQAPASASPVEPIAQATPAPEIDDAIIARVNALAERLEKLGAALEQGPVSA
ncbi:cell division protein ZapA [Novosphingobium sp. MMS21-SN21R]|uniref:cell division protein ZapA n=1 Tax=Novosphingobium sp. MMS21-SN21R TaxID=2969298 RepID=UPI00288873AF|nr:cell division protein ZapA [Novosphingobium sp. MMS21-SN21R]MDT0508043.1 cell division protein ZapA [Novosphingobium sp. MMS21-SN21R]